MMYEITETDRAGVKESSGNNKKAQALD
jgi:hypothetical protein